MKAQIALCLSVSFWSSILFFAASCNKLPKDELPIPTEDTTLSGVSNLRVTTDASGNASIVLDSSVKGRRVTYSFGPLSFGHFLPSLDARSLIYVDTTEKNWEKDSTWFEACLKNGKCKSGFLVVKNSLFIPDTNNVVIDTCLVLAPRTEYVLSGSAQPLNLQPSGVASGAIRMIENSHYEARILENDSMKISYITNASRPNDIYSGFDDLNYKIMAGNGKCYIGQLEIIIGDTGESRAKPDDFSLNGATNLILNWTKLLENDQSNGGITEDATIRLTSVSYLGNKTIQTQKGFITDTLIGPDRVLYYTRNPGQVGQDRFRYFSDRMSDNFVSRAWITVSE